MHHNHVCDVPLWSCLPTVSLLFLGFCIQTGFFYYMLLCSCFCSILIVWPNTLHFFKFNHVMTITFVMALHTIFSGNLNNLSLAFYFTHGGFPLLVSLQLLNNDKYIQTITTDNLPDGLGAEWEIEPGGGCSTITDPSAMLTGVVVYCVDGTCTGSWYTCCTVVCRYIKPFCKSNVVCLDKILWSCFYKMDNKDCSPWFG